jgi:hypothetical protein
MKNIRTLLQQARYKMWEEPTNSVGTGANVALPPAHEPPGIPASKKKKKYDGRTKAGRKLVNRILLNRDKRAKKKMAQEQHIIEADDKKEGPSETERAQKQIAQQKKLNKQKEVQKKAQDAKGKMQNKTKEMDTLMKARLSDFRKKAARKQTSLQRQTQESVEIEEAAGTQAPGVEVLGTLMKLAQEDTYGNQEVEGHVQFKDGRSLRVNSDVAKRMVSTFEALDAARQDQYRFLMNKSVESFLQIMRFDPSQM